MERWPFKSLESTTTLLARLNNLAHNLKISSNEELETFVVWENPEQQFQELTVNTVLGYNPLPFPTKMKNPL